MTYLSVTQMAQKLDVSERTVRHYCACNKIKGAFLTGKTWNIPENAVKPERINKKNSEPPNLLGILKAEFNTLKKDGIYNKIQTEFTYSTNYIEGSKLTLEQTKHMYETGTIGAKSSAVNVFDVIEAVNHFKCFNMIIDNAEYKLTEKFIKTLHLKLKSGTTDLKGEYKKITNKAGKNETVSPKDVDAEIKKLLRTYNAKDEHTFEEIIDFHFQFEKIHAFQNGNGRVGRLIMFKECLKNNIVPFIIDDSLKMLYLKGLSEWENEKNYLIDTCLSAQNKFKMYLEYYQVPYKN